MDFIVRDLFDIVEQDAAALQSVWAQVIPLPPAEQSPDMRAILAHPRMLDCLAFHEMWTRCGLGGYPSRISFTIFHRALRVDKKPMDDALLGVFSQSLHLAEKMRPSDPQQYRRVYELAHASFAASEERCAIALLDKVIRRHVLLPRREAVLKAPNIGASLVDRLVHVYENEAPATLAAFEAWCCMLQPHIAAATPASNVNDYAGRTRAVVGAFELGFLDPVTGMYTGDAMDNVGWSCIEALAHGVSVNGYLWRADTRGAVYVSPPTEAGKDVIDRAMDRVFVRHLYMPWRIFLSVCPSALYDRIIVRLRAEEESNDLYEAGCALKAEAAMHSSLLRLEIVPLGACCRAPVKGPRIQCVDFSCEGKDDRSLLSPLGERLVFPDWSGPTKAPALLSSTQTELLSRYSTCPFAKNGEAYLSGVGGMHDFIIRYAHARGLLRGALRSRNAASIAAPPLGCLVTVDNRPNVWSMLSVLITLDNLDVSRWPTVVVVCAPENARFVERSLSPELLPACTQVIVRPLDELSRFPREPGGKEFNIERYSLLLKQKDFWEGVRDCVAAETRTTPPTYALMVQDDGMLVRPGLEARIDETTGPIAYLGAPWRADAPYNEELKRRVKGMVGNGGLSLRNVHAMIQLSEAGGASQRLFAHNAIPEPEDVFFSRRISSGETEWKPSPDEAAMRFAFEQCEPRPDTLGFHKPWGYLPPETVARFFTTALEEAAARPQ